MISISLAKKLKEFGERHVSAGKFSDIEDYMRDVIRKDQKRVANIAEIQAALDESEASAFVPFDPDEFLQHLMTLEPRDAANSGSYTSKSYDILSNRR
jgi:antitoxin ParD1/3/4